MMLTIELVPKSAWRINIRSEVSKSEWDRIRKAIYKKAGYKCEICSAKGRIECHEIWEYDDEECFQRLVGLIALCPSCHQVKHIGLAQVKGKYEQARKHLAKVNGWTIEDTEQYIRKQFGLWQQRSKKEWKLDYSWLKENVPVI